MKQAYFIWRCYVMKRLLLLFLLFYGAWVVGQSFNVPAIKTERDHVAFFRVIRAAHQEFPERTGAIILQFGYDSETHLAHRDSLSQRNSILRKTVETYLNVHGFPQQDDKVTALRREAQEELFRRLRAVGLMDTLARDSILMEARQEYREQMDLFAFVPVVMSVLDTEPDFARRCVTISWLRFEWEEGNLSLVSILSYLRHTYRLRHGEELSIPTGTTERERLMMYARELSGCWGV